MTRQTRKHARATESTPFALFAIDFHLALIQDHIGKVAANDDSETAQLRKRWTRAQAFLSAARTALGHVSNGQYELEYSRAFPPKPTPKRRCGRLGTTEDRST